VAGVSYAPLSSALFSACFSPLHHSLFIFADGVVITWPVASLRRDAHVTL